MQSDVNLFGCLISNNFYNTRVISYPNDFFSHAFGFDLSAVNNPTNETAVTAHEDVLLHDPPIYGKI